MMKSWADHSSSDEESLDHEINEQLASQQLDDEINPPEAEDVAEPEVAPPPEKVYDFPTRPPFTAFVGNIAYSVDEGEKLMAGLSDVATDRLGEGKINVISGRVATDRNGRHRGFGYVELETLDQLKLLMELNDGQSMIAGRKIQLDTANDRNNNNNRRNDKKPFFENRSSDGVDGSKFRGGLFDNNNRRSGGESDAPAQRTSLKLAPRSKPREGGGNSPSSNIFGGAKARDEQSWEKKRLEDKDNNPERRRSSQNRGKGRGDGGPGGRGDVGKGRGDGGRGGRGDVGKARGDGGRGGRGDVGKARTDGGRGGRGDGGKGRGDGGRGGRGDNKNKKSNKHRNPQPQEAPEEKADKAAAKVEPAPATATAKAAAKVEPAPAKKAAPTNTFALLMDSDSD